MKNKKIILIVAGIVVLAGVFYGGMVYGKSKIPNRVQGGQEKTFGQNGQGGALGMRNGGVFGGMTTGEILSKDLQSITLKLRDGGSKIIFFTDKTAVQKMADGTVSDLAVGKEVTITGTTNPDGSINAQSIQIRPAVSQQ